LELKEQHMVWIGKAAAAAALMGVAVFGGWACSDDSGEALSLEEYFQKLDEAENKFTESGDAVFEGTSEEPTPEELEEVLGEFTDVIGTFVSDLEALEPPEEAQEAHDAAVAAGSTASDAYDELVEAAGDAESAEALFNSPEGEAANTAVEAFSEVCVDLQEVADSNNIEVDLNCDDEGE
jgi:hypothetical protein